MMFSFLNQIRHKPINITTIENPIEYRLEGLYQVEIHEKAGLDFCATLRSILRQDPDVILIGEIRDGIVADIAIQAALTGHLVFSTLHTNDAPSAIARLIDMGVKPFLVASSIQAIMAQRLVRVICDGCKVLDDRPDPQWNLTTEIPTWVLDSATDQTEESHLTLVVPTVLEELARQIRIEIPIEEF